MIMVLKGILWSFVFIITTLIFIVIPTYLIFEWWAFLNILVDLEGEPIYTFALFAVFLYCVSVLVALIYAVATVRALVQCTNEEGLGIPKGVKGFGLVVDLIIIAFFLIWYYFFGAIAVFSWNAPY